MRDNKAVLHKHDVAEAEQALKRGRMALAKSTDRSNLEETANYLRQFAEQMSEKRASAKR